MKKKNRKRRKHRQPVRRASPAVRAKRRDTAQQKKTESASVPWLRIVPAVMEGEPGMNVSRRSHSLRSGGRHSPDFDLYTPEENSSSR